MYIYSVSGTSPSLKPQPLHSSGVTGCLVLRNPSFTRRSTAWCQGEALKWWQVAGGWRPCSRIEGDGLEEWMGVKHFIWASLSPLTQRWRPWLVRRPDVRGPGELGDWPYGSSLCLRWPHEVSPSCHKLALIARGRCATFLLLVAIT